MKKKPENPRAFPTIIDCPETQFGMTLRDYFAAAALQGLLANPKLADVISEKGVNGGWVEDSAFAWADSMLETRQS